MSELISGDVQLDRLLRDLPKKITINSYKSAARKGANILKDSARSFVPNTGPRAPKGMKAATPNFEHQSYIRRAIRVFSSKSRNNPGVYIKPKGPDLPIGQGKTRRFWRLDYYARLVAFGSIRRFKRSNNKGDPTGQVKGIGDFFGKAVAINGKRARQVMIDNLKPEIDKRIRKMSFKGGM